MNGEPQSSSGTDFGACGKFGIRADEAAYGAGRQEGLMLFCTAENGRRAGAEGKNYYGVCPANLEPDFMREFRIGQKERELSLREENLRAREQELNERELRAEFSGARRECTFNSDCKIKSRCAFGRCQRNGRSCTFDSDCEIEGRCSPMSRYVNGRYVTSNHCEF